MLFMRASADALAQHFGSDRAVDTRHAADTVEREAVPELNRRQLDRHEDEERKALRAARQPRVEQPDRGDGHEWRFELQDARVTAVRHVDRKKTAAADGTGIDHDADTGGRPEGEAEIDCAEVAVAIRWETQRHIEADLVDRHPERSDLHTDRRSDTDADRWIGGKPEQEIQRLNLDRPEIEIQRHHQLDASAPLEADAITGRPARGQLEGRLNANPAQDRVDEAVALRHVDDELAALHFRTHNRLALERAAFCLRLEAEPGAELRRLEAAATCFAQHHHRRAAIFGDHVSRQLERCAGGWRCQTHIERRGDGAIHARIETRFRREPEAPRIAHREFALEVLRRLETELEPERWRVGKLRLQAEQVRLENGRLTRRLNEQNRVIVRLQELLDAHEQRARIEVRCAKLVRGFQVFERVGKEIAQAVDAQLAPFERRQHRVRRIARHEHFVDEPEQRQRLDGGNRFRFDVLDDDEVEELPMNAQQRGLQRSFLSRRERCCRSRIVERCPQIAQRGDEAACIGNDGDSASQDLGFVIRIDCRDEKGEVGRERGGARDRCGHRADYLRMRGNAGGHTNTNGGQKLNRATAIQSLLQWCERAAQLARDQLERAGFGRHQAADSFTPNTACNGRPGKARTSRR